MLGRANATASEVDVVIVAYRSASTLRACLAPLLRDPGVSSVVVVDNSADAETRALVHALPGPVSYLPLDNPGFAVACNIGAALGAAPHVLLLNPDVALTVPVRVLLRPLASGAAVSSGLLRTGGACPSNLKRLSTPYRELLRALVGSTRAFSVDLPTTGGLERCDQVDGACLAMGRSLWERLGGLDERYELFYEDVDVCRRAAAHGGCAVVAVEVGHHAGGASSRQAAEVAYRALQVSRLRYLRAWDGRAGALVGVLCVLVELFTRTAGRGEEGGRARLHALVDVVRELKAPGTVRVLTRREGPAGTARVGR